MRWYHGSVPIFDFECEKCGQKFQEQLPFGSKDFPRCITCKGPARKLISPPMVHFKGKGFYKTDSLGKPADTSKPAEKKEEAKPIEKKEAPKPPSSDPKKN